VRRTSINTAEAKAGENTSAGGAARATKAAVAAALIMVTSLAAACGGPDTAPPVIHQLKEPADVFVILGVAGLGCSATPNKLTANGARVARCGPIAGIQNSFLTVGQYPTAEIAEQEYLKFCDADGWSIYRHGQNWRGVMGVLGGKGIPETVAKRIGRALHTDVHGPCASPARSPTP
jgi:hypothetical protein